MEAAHRLALQKLRLLMKCFQETAAFGELGLQLQHLGPRLLPAKLGRDDLEQLPGILDPKGNCRAVVHRDELGPLLGSELLVLLLLLLLFTGLDRPMSLIGILGMGGSRA